MAINAIGLRNAIDALRDLIQKNSETYQEIRGFANKQADDEEVKDDEIRNAYAKIGNKIAEIERIITVEGAMTGFSSFLVNMGSSLVEAQKRLDEESDTYNKQLQRSGLDCVQPSVFRIPKITAKMKCDFERIDDREFNIFIYRRSSQAQERHEQSLDFELVSTPPPPEVVAKLLQKRAELNLLQEDLPKIEWVIDPDERRSIFESVKRESELQPMRNRILIWRASGERMYILARTNKSDARVGVWLLKSDEDERKLLNVIEFKAPAEGSGLAELRNWFVKLADIQENYYKAPE